MTKQLEDLPLSALFSGPLIAAIDANVAAQTETVELLREYGYDEDGNLVTVSFGYTTTEPDPETGESRRVARELEIPLLLFLSVPNLVIHEIEEEFSAKITTVEEPDDDEADQASLATASKPRYPIRPLNPTRLKVTPSTRETAVDRTSRSSYDLNVRMVAEVTNQSAGMDRLERVASTMTNDRIDEERTERLNAEQRTESDGGRPTAPSRGLGRTDRAFEATPNPSDEMVEPPTEDGDGEERDDD
ncbi:DUF2589 domain-containing protein [Halovivax limisalsi]|uniref:DUF2589 domain-containing protein n=1 Tax=Halovivax limisalsi TaxID=1453760 RepID=UPI001FFD4DE7|nr:DUF2589 domain-containing protein [Halovivax limisalsi]